MTYRKKTNWWYMGGNTQRALDWIGLNIRLTSDCREVGASSSVTTVVSQTHGSDGRWCTLGDWHTTTRVCLLLKEHGTSWSHLLIHRPATVTLPMLPTPGLPGASFQFLYKNHAGLLAYYFNLPTEKSYSAVPSDTEQLAFHFFMEWCCQPIFVSKDQRTSFTVSWS